jgi:uncharacterized protein
MPGHSDRKRVDLVRRSRRTGLLILGAVIVLAVMFGPNLAGFYVDWLWYGEVGQRKVFWTLFNTRLWLGVLFGLALTALTYVNLAIARRSTPRYIPRPDAPEWQRAAGTIAREGLTAVLIGGSVVLGLLGGMLASGEWDDWIRFTHRQPFGVRDPVFNTDVGFYIFQYPFLQFLNGWLFGTLLLVAAATAAVYYMDGAVSFHDGEVRIANSVRVHLSILFGLAMLAKAWDFWLDRYGLLVNPGGVVFGAGYTDIHARLPALNILMVVALIAAAGFFLNARIRALWLPGLAVAVMLVAGVTVGGIYPGVVQRFTVVPNQQNRERPFIQRHLDFTRQAYGLDHIQARDYSVGKALSRADIATYGGTLDNIRLWDYRVIGQAYRRLQGLRDYYELGDVDIDRYVVRGKYRQVMLAARELVTERLNPQQRSWVNQTLQYTHGYGLVMSGVNEADAAGRPVWLVHNLPLETKPGLELTRPQIYYGLQDHPPVIAPSAVPEIDYPKEADNQTSTYTGTGGIPLSSTWMRVLFSAYLGEWNLYISNQVQQNSRVLVRRNVTERIARLAPFLRYDKDPYLVIHEGKLVWLQDAYTVASRYPYSEPSRYGETAMLGAGAEGLEETLRGDFNYIRNSVKVVVDAYDGEVTLYAIDEEDPLLRSYRKAFPALFRSADQMPPGLRAHLRYPEDMLRIQARKWTRFHVQNPDIFYAQSDVWAIPEERLEESAGETTPAGNSQMEPYYVIMRLPGEQKDEFALILPFKTRAGTTMAAWLAARCDGEDYGQLRLYRFPTNNQIDAPEQAENAILVDPKVSQTTTLLNRGSSRVRYGNMLVLPVASSLLYVKPFYVEATGQAAEGRARGIPELKYVILAEKRGDALKVVMHPTLRESLAALVGAEVPPSETTEPSPAPGPAPTPGPANAAQLAAEAEAAFEAADRALREGNWAEYGRQMERARSAIRRLRAATQGR